MCCSSGRIDEYHVLTHSTPLLCIPEWQVQFYIAGNIDVESRVFARSRASQIFRLVNSVSLLCILVYAEERGHFVECGVDMSHKRKATQRADAAFQPIPTIVRYFRFKSSGLWTTPDITIPEVVSLHFGVQAQDPGASMLCLWQRHRKSCYSTLFNSLLTRPVPHSPVVRVWGQRGTLHLYTIADWPIATGAVRSQLRRLSESRTSQCKGGKMLCTAVEEAVRKKLLQGKIVDSSIVDKISQGMSASDDARARAGRHAFMHATVDGHASRILPPHTGARIVLAPRPATVDWQFCDEFHAVREAARRYFEVYAPASELDFRYWMGINAALSRDAVLSLLDDGELQTVPQLGDGFLIKAGGAAERFDDCADHVPNREEWPVRLLGRFDAYLLPHQDKSWLVCEEFRNRVWTRNADILPTVIVYGRIRGIWRANKSARRLQITVTLFPSCADPDGPLTERERRLITEEAKRIGTDFWRKDSVAVEILEEESAVDIGDGRKRRRAEKNG